MTKSYCLGMLVGLVTMAAFYAVTPFIKGWRAAGKVEKRVNPDIDVEQGVIVHAAGTAAVKGVVMIREGCSGSPRCALEIYASEGTNYLSLGAINLHFDGLELEHFYQAVKAVRNARRGKRE